MDQVHSLEQVCDAVISLIVKNAGARTLLTSNLMTGGNVALVNNTFHFEDAEQIVLIDMNDGHIEYNSILKKVDTTTLILSNNVQSDYLTTNTATIQKAIGNVTLPSNAVLFGDREVIPNPELTIVVDPVTMNNSEWMYLRGGLNVQYNLIVTVYAKLDDHDHAIRVTQKYGDYLFGLLMNNIHLDVVNDDRFLASDAASGQPNVTVADAIGFAIDTASHRYSVQDNLNDEDDFYIYNVAGNVITLDRNLVNTYRVSDKALFRRKMRYIYNALVTDVEYGFIQKGSQMFKAARLNWWGKEIIEIMFPQRTSGGLA